MERLSLCGSSVRGTWREGSFTGDPEGCVKEGCGNRRPSLGDQKRALPYWGLATIIDKTYKNLFPLQVSKPCFLGVSAHNLVTVLTTLSLVIFEYLLCSKSCF